MDGKIPVVRNRVAPVPRRPPAAPPDALESLLEELVAAGAGAWPTFALSERTFAMRLAEGLPDGDPEEALRAMCITDLYLACACGDGLPAAIEAFEVTFFQEIDLALSRRRHTGLRADDVRQVMREKLFVARVGRRPQIADYAGRGPLRGWFRAVLARTLVNLATRGPREALGAEDDALFELAESAEGAEMSHLRRLYSAELACAFPEALAALTVRERALLRQHYLDEVTLDELSALYSVHRATAKRQLAKARANLLDALRGALCRRLGISATEFDSIIRVVQSQLEFPIRGMFTVAEASGD